MSEGKEVKFPGDKVTIGDREFIVPPLNFRQLEDHAEALARFAHMVDSKDPWAELRGAIPVIHAAISRNYPDIKLDELKDIVDLGNYRKIIEAIMGVSGISEEMLKSRLPAPGGVRPVVVPTGASPRPS